MCGIVGILNQNAAPVSPAVLQGMTDAIAHRGPDGEGLHVDRFVGLGHRRLAILDLSSAGHQPMIAPNGGYVIVYNGEIYNFRELRRELENIGHRFRSQSDTEVVLLAYAQWGPECLQRLNGMFAFAIWDKHRQELFLARDRYGIKPLYYCFQDGTFVFASEQKAILAHPDVKREVDLEALLEYFTFQNFFTDRTLLKNVKMFPAGSWAVLRGSSAFSNLQFTRYWDFHFCEPDTPLRPEEYVEELLSLLTRAVRRQLVADVEIGAYLSGGIDSGAITAIAAKEEPFLKSFTCGFDLQSASGIELAFDERKKAEYMSYLYKTEHYEMVLKAGDMERILPSLAYHMEEPRVGQSYPNYYMAKLASKFVKVVLSGSGGDELFAGYPWRYYRAAVSQDFDDYVDRYYLFWQRLVPNSVIRRLFSAVWPNVQHVRTRDIFQSVFSPSHAPMANRPEDYINRSLYFEAKTFLHGLLVMEDKLSMAHGMEMRVPMLDNDLVDFAMRVPVSLKLLNLQDVVRLNENQPGDKAAVYCRQTNDGKVLLRKALERYMPHEVTSAVKQGFSAPDASWFKGESLDYVRREILGDSARIYDFLDPPVVHELVNEHLEGRQNRRLLIWSLLSVEWWLRNFSAQSCPANAVPLSVPSASAEQSALAVPQVHRRAA